MSHIYFSHRLPPHWLMIMAASSRFACLVAMFIATAPIAERSAAAQIWLSPYDSLTASQSPPANDMAVPRIGRTTRGTGGALYIWARLDAGKALENWSLDVFSSNPEVVRLTGSAVSQYNPLMAGGVSRWLAVSEPASTPAGTGLLQTLRGTSVSESGAYVGAVGIGAQGTGGSYADPYYHSTSNAWLLARVDYKLTGLEGSAEIFLRIGSLGMNYFGDTAASFSATLGALSDPALVSPEWRQKKSNTPEAIISVTPPGPADFDGDGAVDGADFLTWQRGVDITSGATPSQGDANGDGAINAADLTVWRQRFGSTAAIASAVSTTVAVPEPAAWGLAALAFLGVRRRFRDDGLDSPSDLSTCRRNIDEPQLVVPMAGAKIRLLRPLLWPALIALIAYLTQRPATMLAENVSWDGGGENRRWSVPQNWSPNGVPGAGDVAVLGGVGAPKLDQINLDVWGAVNAIRFNNTSDNIYLTDQGFGPQLIQLFSNEVGIAFYPNFTGQIVRLDTQFVLENSQTWDIRSAGQTLRVRDINLNGRQLTLTGPVNSNFIIDGVVTTAPSPLGTLVMNSAGELRLNGTTNFNGLDVRQGTAIMNTTAAAGAGNISVQGGATFAASVAGSGAIGIGASGRFVILGGSESNASHFQLRNSNDGGAGSRIFWYGNIQVDGYGVLSTNGNPANVIGQVDGFLVGSGKLITRDSISLARANPFSGDIRSRAGRLTIDHSHALQNATLIRADGDSGYIAFSPLLSSVTLGGLAGSESLVLQNDHNQPVELRIGNNNAALTYSGQLSGTGSLTKIGSGQMQLTGNNLHTGGVKLESGQLVIYNNSNLGSNSGTLTLQGGELWTNGAMTLARPINVTGSATLTIGPSTVIGGNLYGSGTLTKQGIGSLTFTAPSSHTGTINILQGPVQAANHNVLSDASTFVISNGASLVLSNFSDTIGALSGEGTVSLGSGSLAVGANNASTTYAGSITGSGSLTKTGAGTLTLTGNNSHGATAINQGTLQIGNGGTNGTLGTGATTIAAGANLMFNRGDAYAYSGDINGSGSLTKNGGGDLILSPSTTNSFTGGATLNAGRLFVKTNALGTGRLTLNGGTLFTSITSAAGSPFSGNMPITISGSVGTIDTYGNTATLSGNISGSGKLHKTGWGTLTITGDNTYLGGTDISLHYLQGTSQSIRGPISFAVNGQTKGVIFDQSFEGEFNSAITGEGSFTKTGGGKLKLTGNSNYTGGTTINDGVLAVNGSLAGPVVINSGGTLGGGGTIVGNVSGPGRVAPGNSPGILTINGNYAQTADSVLEIEVDSYSGTLDNPSWIAGTNHDQLQVTGTATLGGKLEVPIIDPLKAAGGPPLNWPPIKFLTAGNVTGTFNAIVAPGLGPNLTVDVDYINSGPNQGAMLSFVLQKTNVVFDENSNNSADWFNDDDTWEDLDNLGTPVIPSTVNDISIQNLTTDAQEVKIETGNAFVGKLSVGGGSDALTIKVGDGTPSGDSGNLSSVIDVTVEQNGVIAMNGGTLATPNVALVDGGEIKGNGRIDLSGETSSYVGELHVSSGVVSPGFSIGELDIDGNYTQAAAGELKIEIGSPTQFDKIDVSGIATLGGKVTLEVTDEMAVAPGTVIEVMTAGSLVPGAEFDDVITSGSDAIRFVPVYEGVGASGISLFSLADGATVSFEGHPVGDLNLDDVFNPNDPQSLAADVAAMALAIVNPQGYKYAEFNLGGTAATIMGRVNRDDYFDFDDLAAFRQLAGISMAEMMAAVRAAQAAVPEPSAWGMALVAAAVCRQCNRRIRSDEGC